METTVSELDIANELSMEELEDLELAKIALERLSAHEKTEEVDIDKM